MFTHTIRTVFSRGDESLDKTVTLNPDAEDNRSLSIPTATTDQQILIAFTLASLKDYYIVSDRNILLETNATNASGGDAINLVANEPISWNSQAQHAKHFSQNVTTMYITNVSGQTANIEIRIGKDSTP